MSQPDPTADEEWFILFDDDDPDSEEEPELTGLPAAVMGRLRDSAPTWKRLGVEARETLAQVGPGVLRVGVDVVDRGNTILSTLRVDVTDSAWVGGWASAGNAMDENDFDDTMPREVTRREIGDPAAAVEQIAGWLEAQLQRPVTRYVWTEDGEVVAEDYVLTDAGISLIGSGEPGAVPDPATSDQAIPVRP